MQRAEIITVERRRRWSLSDKQQIVAETLQPGASVSTIAQRYGMHPSQLFAWRKAARDGRLVEDSRVEFAPVVIASELPEPVALPHRLRHLRRAVWRSRSSMVGASSLMRASMPPPWRG